MYSGSQLTDKTWLLRCDSAIDELESILRFLEYVETCRCEYSVSRLREMNSERHN